MPVTEEMITTAPPPAARRCGRPDLISSAACPALSANVAVNSSGPALVRLPEPTVPPALATRWSRPPSAVAMSSTARFSASVSVTSATAVATGVPRGASRSAAAARPAASRATSPTAVPSAASASATANPMPLLPPVTNARLPCRPRSIKGLLSWDDRRFHPAGPRPRPTGKATDSTPRRPGGTLVYGPGGHPDGPGRGSGPGAMDGCAGRSRHNAPPCRLTAGPRHPRHRERAFLAGRQELDAAYDAGVTTELARDRPVILYAE